VNVYLQSIATANPPLYVTQQQALQFYTRHFEPSAATCELYRKILSGGGIDGRYVGIDAIEDAAQQDPDLLAARFLKVARQLAAAAADKALQQLEMSRAAIGAVVVTTCTGYCCPGLSSYLIADLELDPSTRAYDLVGMGCGGALPNLHSAGALLQQNPDKAVLSVAVEVCSATLFPGDDPALIVSNCIFGDGAAAVVLTTTAHARGLALRMIDCESLTLSEHRDELRYRTEQGRLRNVLTRRVPMLGARSGLVVASRLCQRQATTPPQIAHWCVHPGGTAVLAAVERVCEVEAARLRHSYAVLRQYGNMSSPSVLFVLQRTLTAEKISAGQRLLLLAFGAGFSAHALLLEAEVQNAACE